MPNKKDSHVYALYLADPNQRAPPSPKAVRAISDTLADEKGTLRSGLSSKSASASASVRTADSEGPAAPQLALTLIFTRP